MKQVILNRSRHERQPARGFTLVELLVVIAIIGILLTVTDFGEGDVGIHREKRRPGGFGASFHGNGVG